MLTEKENIVFSFSPWAIQNWNDLWEDFGNRLLEALSAARIPFDGSWKKAAKDSGKWLESRGLGQVAQTAAAFFGGDKLYNAAFGALSRWLRYDGARISAIREKLQNRRLVVLFDDLDRCAPELIPQLLLSLRELLDLPALVLRAGKRQNLAMSPRTTALIQAKWQPSQETASPRRHYRRTKFLLILLIFFLPQSARPTASDRAPIMEALGWVRSAPADAVQFDYVMTARVRLLFFWAGKDDVGGGFIRRGFSKNDPRQELLQVLFGSDPAKAPKAINRWGAGTEVVRHREIPSTPAKGDDVVSSAFFGFMKSSTGKSVSEMQQELKNEKDHGEHQFTGILSRVDAGHAISLTVPLASEIDYNLHQYAEAEPVMLEKLSSSERPARILENPAGCMRAGEFLGTVSELLESALQNHGGPLSLCYVYDAQVNTLKIEHSSAVPKLAVKVKTAKGAMLADRTYQDLLETDFVSENHATGKRVPFTILVGTKGEQRGVPIQIRYQPNWWFQVVLNLLPKSAPQVQPTH